ncbi:MAG: CDP-alcohol phosphatidyltransferase family protein [Candidatus Woesearchaeota archaeon]|nr:CDP-alcohol phosphatidyltransferase family protein [Candidatus Woesearchaeota archaeon]
MVSISELRKTQHPKSQQDFYVKHIYRKFSIIFTWFFVNLGISANIVTVISFLFDVLAVYLVFKNSLILAAIAIQFGIILDVVDGEVARYNNSIKKLKEPKKFGAYLDEVLGVIGFATAIFAFCYIKQEYWLGFAAIIALVMMNLTSAISSSLFTTGKSNINEFKKSLFGNLSDAIAFGMTPQRAFITLAFLLDNIYFIWFFTIVGNFYWIIRFKFYKNL